MKLRTYALIATFGLALNVSGQLIWTCCPKLDIIDVLAWAVFIAVAASMAFVLLTEPRKRRQRPVWMTGRISGLSVMVTNGKRPR